MSHKANDEFYNSVRDFFENPQTPEMYDITREAWMAGYFAGRGGEDINEAFREFRGDEPVKA